MQIIKSCCILLFFISPLCLSAQSTYLQQGDKGYLLLERMEIKARSNAQLNFSGMKYLNRQLVTREAERIDSMSNADSNGIRLSAIDRYNLRSFYMNNSEWVSGSREGFASRKPVLKHLYTTPAHLFEVHSKDFFMAVNPILQVNLGSESGNNERLFQNTRGLSVRGRIANKIGFFTSVTDNQERGPGFFHQWVNSYRAVPGVGFYKTFKRTAVDYFDVRGYFTVNVAKYIDVQFGHDKNFIGNGYRSLFLSDWGNSYLFLKLNTRIWKLNYQNILMELMPQFVKTSDAVLDRKYQVMHHLSINVSKSVNIGIFEAVTFGRRNHFDFQYLNPIIFLRPIESGSGSGDKAKVGFDFKANVAGKFQFYGQLLIDEFVLNKLRNDKNNYVNKYGYQLGAKYIDAFGVSNLDLQVETNRVRPFTYSHRDSLSNYTHYNQPMAHPLGANFQEFIGILRYQPAKKWYVYARAIYYYQGLDSAGLNFGGNPFRNYDEGRPLNNPSNPAAGQRESGYFVGSGLKGQCLNALLQLSYEWKENLYFEASVQHRNYKIAQLGSNTSNTMITAGIRWNIARRVYDF